MRARQRVALAGVVVLAGQLLTGQVLVPPAGAVAPVALEPGDKPDKPENANRKPGKPNKKPEKPEKANKKPDKKPDNKPRKKRDRVPPATPALGGPGVGAGGRVSLPVIAEGGSYVVVTELGGPVVATGTGTGGYSSLAWTASHGAHRYVVTATDRAGNTSGSAQTRVVVDALAPRLRAVRLTPGKPSDTRTRVVFRTDAGSTYRIWAGGRSRASGTATAPRAVVVIDLANGRHRVEVVVKDGVGNTRTSVSTVAVRVPELAVTSEYVGEPTERTQEVQVRATPTAQRGVLRLPGEDAVAFVMRRGAATIELDLEDGSHPAATVVVRDTRGRSGRAQLPGITVDTVPPTLAVTPDEDAAADGMLGATVTAEAGTDVRWQLVDPQGTVVESGEVATTDGRGTISADVEEGSYRLVVAATDGFDRTTKVRAGSQVADDPLPFWLVGLLFLGGAFAALTALAGLVRGVRWARDPASPVRTALARVGNAAARRLRVLVAPVPERDAAATVAALFEPDDEGPRVPFPRVASRAGGALPPDEEVLHRAPVRLYETAEEREDGPVLGSRTAELVLARERIALVDDRTGDVWSGRIAVLAHVRDDTTMVLPAGETGWIGLVYADPELTRPALDLVAADHSERDLAPAGSVGHR